MVHQRKPSIWLTGYDVAIVGNRTCPSSVAFGHDIADQGVEARTQQAMLPVGLEGLASSSSELPRGSAIEPLHSALAVPHLLSEETFGSR